MTPRPLGEFGRAGHRGGLPLNHKRPLGESIRYVKVYHVRRDSVCEQAVPVGANQYAWAAEIGKRKRGRTS